MNTDTYRVEPGRGGYFVVNEKTGERFGAYPSPEAAESIADSLRQEPAPVGPEIEARRQRDKAYRTVEGDPVLSIMKRIFPRVGEAARNTKRSHERSLKFVGAHMSIAASNPKVHAELNKSPGARRVTKARKANTDRGADTRALVAARLAALADVPARKRASQIAAELHLDPIHVRRIINQIQK